MERRLPWRRRMHRQPRLSKGRPGQLRPSAGGARRSTPPAKPGHYSGSTADHEQFSFDIAADGLSLLNLHTGQMNESCTPPDYYLSGGQISAASPFTVGRDGSFNL
jgi:hypothetical protein